MTIALSPGPTYPADRGAVYLPIVAVAPVDPVATFYDLLMHDIRQQRSRLTVCRALEAAAAWKAADIAANDYWDHRAFNGEWPNDTARRFGCNLPPEYSDGQNYIESLCAGSADAQAMFDSLAESPSHRTHLFGLNDFFSRQTHVGIACAVGGRWGWVWAIYIAECTSS